MNTDPTAIKFDPEKNLLEITWADGHVSRYAGAYLRLVCPCALCQGHSPGEVEPPAWEDVKDVTVANAAGAGTYALKLTFSDGHDTGIYAFQTLREACPSTRDDLDEVGRPVA